MLAGGASTRMGGGDKCMLPLGGRPLLARIIERLRPEPQGRPVLQPQPARGLC
ncbi:MAG: NTP transferase domain-containing protein [Methyloceanibacter sp.]